MTLSAVALGAGILLMLVGAIGVLVVREAMRLVVSLGTFLLGIALVFIYYGYAFLGVAQIFVYVGGVLVLVLFAVMLLTRGPGGRPVLATRHDVGAAVTSLAIFGILLWALVPEFPALVPDATGNPAGDLAAHLLGERLIAFELLGVFLLVAFVAVLAISGGGDAE